MPLEAEFLAAECPATFLADLDATIAEVEEALGEKAEALGNLVEGTADLEALNRKTVATVRQLAGLIQAKFADRPGVLAEWKSVSRIKSPAKSKPTPAPEFAPVG